MAAALIELIDVWKEYPAGEQKIAVLKGINLRIEKGEMAAIVGASGSGKSTLMNIMGCLDTPTRGTYVVNGQDTASFEPDELAALRREYFGFIFQRYHLLGDHSAVGNVEIPAINSGVGRADRRARAIELLEKVGLADRLSHKPGQLSGGQQQRVSIARALMNGGEVILADEPTGALDTKSGEQTMALIKELHDDGHTVILVTHDPIVARHAERIIEISDGEIVRDERTGAGEISTDVEEGKPAGGGLSGQFARLAEAFHMALLAMASHRLRTFLTMLGIIIGITAVVSVVALGQAAQNRVLSDISALATNTIDIRPGEGFGDRRAQNIRTLDERDARALETQLYVDSVTPSVSTPVTLRYGNIEINATVSGVGVDYNRVRGYDMASGIWFTRESLQKRAQEAVIDDNTYKRLFPSRRDALGQIIILNNVPVRIIGVTKPRESAFERGDTLNIWIPYTSAMTRLTGQSYLTGITVRVSDLVDTKLAEKKITEFLTLRHGIKDFFTINADSIRQTIERTTTTLALLISSIAVISLIVGGIGVMNIMLVSVTERTSEIGVRMAVGARQTDIMKQFLIEAILVCLVGGAIGIGLAFATGYVVESLWPTYRMRFSATSIVTAVACSTLIGLVFGYLPARNAARMNPVDALNRD